MGKIMQFPRETNRDLNLVAAMIRKYLAAMTSDDELIETVAARMDTFVKNYAAVWFEPNFNLAVPVTITAAETAALMASIEKGVDRAAEQVNEILSKIVIERLLLEVEFYKTTQKAASLEALPPRGTPYKGLAARRPITALPTDTTSQP